MEHKEIDFEISTLMKNATSLMRDGKGIEAVDVLKCAISKFEQSELSYSPANYTKIIPYFQKAGIYNQSEKYCLDVMIPSINTCIKKGMFQRCAEIQDMHRCQYISAVYDKLRLSAKREKNKDDEKRFSEQRDYYKQTSDALRPIADRIELEKEYKEIKGIFGEDTSLWSDIFKEKFKELID